MEFEKFLFKKFVDEGLAESSAKLYVSNLKTLSNGNFENLDFLKDINGITNFISEYSPRTQANYIASVLSAIKTTRKHENLYEKYLEELDRIKEQFPPDGEKTDKQKSNWITWEEVLKKRDYYRDKVNKFRDNEQLTPKQFNTLRKWVILCLYTYLPPERNLEFQEMIVGPMPKKIQNKNYFVPSKLLFIFNRFKNVKDFRDKNGIKAFSIKNEPELINVLKLWLKHHPQKDTDTGYLLVDHAGYPLLSVNSLTKIFNSIFKPKKVSSTMLRHIYLTNKYGNIKEEMKKDSYLMGHSEKMQKNYILK